MFSVSKNFAKGVSGYYFFEKVAKKLESDADFNSDAKTTLVNVSISLLELVKLKLRGRRIVIRLDGAYHDRIDKLELGRFPIWTFFGQILQHRFIFNWLFNFFYENWKVELRLLLASGIIYQSNYSRLAHRYFIFGRKLPYDVIPNAYPEEKPKLNPCTERNKILIIVGAHSRKNDIIALRYCIKLMSKTNLSLKIINYEQGKNKSIDAELKTCKTPYLIEILPRYSSLEELNRNTSDCKIFVFLSYRDPCPNVLLETIAFGILPLAIDSGGISELLPKKYPLIPFIDSYDHYSPARYSVDIPKISYSDFEASFNHVLRLDKDAARQDHLSLEAVSSRYSKFLNIFDHD